MAIFKLIDDGTYKVDGEITQEDVDKINAFKIRTCLILPNTKGQSSEVIKQIKTDNVYFSILGGLDYLNKEKFNSSDYIERTESAPKGLAKILEYFEKVEEGINPEWTDTQKCMYAYNALAVDTNYVKDLQQNILSNGVTERGLNGILYNQLTCAGMAQTFKEMMDRLDIPCYYQNQRHKHAFNVVELEGKYRGIDVTWDCTKGNEKNCSFNNFGCNSDFYEQFGHQIAGDSEETIFDLTTFTPNEIRNNYAIIEHAVQKREKIIYPFRNFDKDRKKRFLPVDKFMENLDDEKLAITKLKLLSDFGVLPDGMNEMISATNSRYGFIADYIGTNHGKTRDTLENIRQRCNINGSLTMKNGQVILISHDEKNCRSDKPLTQEQKDEMSPLLLSDVKEYYKQYFENEAPQIDSLLETYSMLESMPPELLKKHATLKTQLYTKIKLFSNGDNFFEQLGIPKEEIELVGNKARACLENVENVVHDSKPKHEYDLDFLYAIIQNDIIDTMVSGKSYTEDELSKLMSDVRTNWQEPDFSDDEFKALLDEALSKTINSEDISKGTLNSEVGLDEVNSVAAEIRRTQTKDLEQSQQK